MIDAGNKPLPEPPEPVPEGTGSGTPPEAAAKPAPSPPRPARKAPTTRRERNPDPRKSLWTAALLEARKLKREHRTCYNADPKGFRKVVAKAHSRVFRMKPGPKADSRIAQAARERAQGAEWRALYPKHIDHYAVMPEFTRDLAETGFQRKVNAHLQRHPKRRRRSQDGSGSASPPN